MRDVSVLSAPLLLIGTWFNPNEFRITWTCFTLYSNPNSVLMKSLAWNVVILSDPALDFNTAFCSSVMRDVLPPPYLGITDSIPVSFQAFCQLYPVWTLTPTIDAARSTVNPW